MSLKTYFENTKGVGVMATANAEGEVNAAIYSRPHVIEDGSIALIMRDRLTHANIQSNPHATYLFKEDGAGYQGKRLYLVKIREEKDPERISQFRRRSPSSDKNRDEPVFLVFFKLEKELPLIGAD